MAELDAALHALARLHRVLVEPEELAATFDRILALIIDAIPVCDQVSISVDTGGLASAAYLGDDVKALDLGQYEDGGPCVHAFEIGEPVLLPEIAADPRWPAFRHEAAKRGLCSSLSFPLIAQTHSLGSINMYGKTVGGFDQRSHRVALLFSEQIAIALANALSAVELLQLADQLREGLRYRDMIGQAGHPHGSAQDHRRCSVRRALYRVATAEPQAARRR